MVRTMAIIRVDLAVRVAAVVGIRTSVVVIGVDVVVRVVAIDAMRGDHRGHRTLGERCQEQDDNGSDRTVQPASHISSREWGKILQHTKFLRGFQALPIKHRSHFGDVNPPNGLSAHIFICRRSVPDRAHFSEYHLFVTRFSSGLPVLLPIGRRLQ